MNEQCLKNAPLWDQDDDGTWITVHLGDKITINEGDGHAPLIGIVTRIVPAQGDPDRLLDLPPQYRTWGDIFFTFTPDC